MACYVFMTLVSPLPLNRHINFALGGALEIATYVFTYFILSRYGRRLPMSAYQSICGVICILTAATIILSHPVKTIGMCLLFYHDKRQLFFVPLFADLTKTIMLLFGRITVMSTVFVAYLYTAEIFPTVIRGTCLGLCTVSAKIGSLCTPHVLLSVKICIPQK